MPKTSQIPSKKNWPMCPDCGRQPKDESWFDDFDMCMYDMNSPVLTDGMLIGLTCYGCKAEFNVRAKVVTTFVVEREE